MQTDLYQELRTKIRGPVMTSSDAGYDDARKIWNGMIDRHPTAIARCLGVADDNLFRNNKNILPK